MSNAHGLNQVRRQQSVVIISFARDGFQFGRSCGLSIEVSNRQTLSFDPCQENENRQSSNLCSWLSVAWQIDSLLWRSATGSWEHRSPSFAYVRHIVDAIRPVCIYPWRNKDELIKKSNSLLRECCLWTVNSMENALESLPNEILMIIFSHFSWNELLTSWWCLNEHLNSLLCSMFWNGEARIIFNRPGLSYKECSTSFIPMITQSSDLSSSVRYIHLDGSNSLALDVFDRWFYSTVNGTSKLCFSNLRSLALTRFLLSESSINCLSRLVRGQLTHLRIEVDKDQCNSALFRNRSAALATARNGKWWWRVANCLRDMHWNSSSIV